MTDGVGRTMMTRQQAIKAADEAWGQNMADGSIGADHVAILEALGVLKLAPEPTVTAEDRLCRALGWPVGGTSEIRLSMALAAAGVKVVEAEK